ncbi:MAG: beta-glucosidase [Paenibacillaceae bacterium]|jgi:beta-N-acetylhexosaminidase|nr:beta-glucosidase [Paenibacillaceae bacterium]
MRHKAIGDWAENVLSRMTLKQKLGQLLLTRASVQDIEELVAEGLVGGFFAANHVSSERLEQLKSMSSIPLLIAQDLEVGFTAGSLKWSSAMSVAAAGDSRLAYEWAYRQGLEARKAGANAVFGPVLDIAMNPRGELCGIRTFGADPHRVADLGAAAARGYQDAGLLPFAKHFPGFGRGPQDAHIELSVLDTDENTLWENDLLPYRKAVEQGLWGVMTGHILAPAVDADLPSPVSGAIMGLLSRMGFHGLTVTDSLAMKGILYHYEAKHLYPQAIISGHDLLLADYQTPDRLGIAYLEEAVEDGRIPEELLDRKVLRILRMKEILENIAAQEVDRPQTAAFYQSIADRSMTGLRTDGKSFQALEADRSILFVIVSQDSVDVEGELSAGENPTSELILRLREDFPHARCEVIPLQPSTLEVQKVLQAGLQAEQVCYIAHTPTRCYMGTNTYMPGVRAMVRGMRSKIHTFVVWGNPYAAEELPPLEQYLFCYDRGPWVDSVARTLKGTLQPQGKIPVPVAVNRS